jgi:hypothetical protein
MSHANTSNIIKTSPSYLSYIEEYIKALVENVNYANISSKINLIFDGGALNAFYAIGIALYIRELQKKNIVIDKVSGCSAGACVGLNFLMNNFSYTEDLFEKLTTCLRNNHNFNILPQLIRENVYSLFDNDDSALEPIQNRLYITYYDVKDQKQHVVHRYHSRDELIEYLTRSSFMPYIINGESRLQEKYIDGIVPYIFSDKLPNLFIKLFSNGRLSRCIMTQSEENPHHRIMAGVADANDFFTTGKSVMCSYMNDWSTIDNILFRSRTMVWFVILNILDIFIAIKSCVPETFCNSLASQGVHKFITDMYHDMLQKLLL